MRAGGSLLRSLGKLGEVDPRKAIDIGKALDDLVSVDALAALLDEGIGKTVTKDGRLDMKDLAAFILRRMKENQK